MSKETAEISKIQFLYKIQLMFICKNMWLFSGPSAPGRLAVLPRLQQEHVG